MFFISNASNSAAGNSKTTALVTTWAVSSLGYLIRPDFTPKNSPGEIKSIIFSLVARSLYTKFILPDFNKKTLSALSPSK